MKKDEIIKHLNRKVIFDNSVYELSKYVAWRSKTTNKLCHAVVLLDKNQNSTIQVPIEKVEVFNDE